MTAPELLGVVRADLARHPPFDQLPPEALARLVSTARVRYLDAGEVLFTTDDSPLDVFYVVKKGSIALRRGGALVDLADDGDLFGVRALLAASTYSATATAREDSLVYELAWPTFRELADAHPRLALFLAAGFASVLPQLRAQVMEATHQAQRTWTAPTWAEDTDGRIEPVRDILTCGPQDSLQSAAARMRQRAVGSIVVIDEARRPLGILTDTDLRNRVVAEGLDPARPVGDVMSAPVRTLSEPQSVAGLMGQVMETGIHHFCFTEDGTPDSPVVGVASEHDLITAHARHPSVLRQKISRSRDPDELRRLRDHVDTMLEASLAHGVDTCFLATVMAGIQDALIRSGVEMAQAQLTAEGMPPPAEPFVWLSFGSEGRKEQLLRTDLDQAIVYADPPEASADAVRQYFLRLGSLATDLLVHVGYARCPGGIMASNPEITDRVSVWRERFTRWIRQPDDRNLMLSTIFFDLRAVAGASDLAQDLLRHVVAQIRAEPAFLPFLAKNALQNPPPLSFFRSIVVERSGEGTERFDIKARAMMPLADAARVLAYDLGDAPGGDTTAARLRRFGEAEPARAALCDGAAMAYEILMRARAQEALRTESSGRYLDIGRLNKLERRTLRNTFAIIEDVQAMLSSRYRVDMMR